ncbi:MAG: DUF5658 family protein [Pseudomonadota bacterium]
MSSFQSREDMVSDAQLAIERRNRQDRRQPSLKGFIIGCFKCRRRQPRRAEGYLHYHTDWYDTKILVMALALVILSIMDAAMTMHLINHHGAVEINPFMNYLLQQGSHVFIYTKLVLTCICVFILAAHYYSRVLSWLRVDIVLIFALFIYMGLVTYEFALLFNSPNAVA